MPEGRKANAFKGLGNHWKKADRLGKLLPLGVKGAKYRAALGPLGLSCD